MNTRLQTHRRHAHGSSGGGGGDGSGGGGRVGSGGGAAAAPAATAVAAAAASVIVGTGAAQSAKRARAAGPAEAAISTMDNPTLASEPVDAIMTLHDPLDWAVEAQIVVDVLRGGGSSTDMLQHAWAVLSLWRHI